MHYGSEPLRGRNLPGRDGIDLSRFANLQSADLAHTEHQFTIQRMVACYKDLWEQILAGPCEPQKIFFATYNDVDRRKFCAGTKLRRRPLAKPLGDSRKHA